MATKKENAEDPNSCWSKAADDEPIFILRAHDQFAPAVVRFWCHLMQNHYIVPAIPGDLLPPIYSPAAIMAIQKIVSAQNVSDQMELWPDRKIPD
jgi:hypothetical protein